MDSLTHLALGACMGEAFAGKTLGKKSHVVGRTRAKHPGYRFYRIILDEYIFEFVSSSRLYAFIFVLCPYYSFICFNRGTVTPARIIIRLRKWMLFFWSSNFYSHFY